MKKSTLILMLSLVWAMAGLSQPQQNALAVKKTATWCSNCGSWGWTWFKDLIAATQDESVIPISLHSTSSALKPEADLDGDWLSHFDTEGGFPMFYVNGTHYSNYQGLLDAALAAADAPLQAGIDLETGYLADTLQARGTVTWTGTGSGEYALGFYLVEDSLVHQQSAQGPNAIHRNVIHLAFQYASFGVLKQVTHDNATVEVWEARHGKTLPGVGRRYILAVLWKLVQGKFQYVNAVMEPLVEGGITSTQLVAQAPDLHMFPQPARPGQWVTIHLSGVTGEKIRMVLSDMQGKTILETSMVPAENAGFRVPAVAGNRTCVLTLFGDGWTSSHVLSVTD